MESGSALIIVDMQNDFCPGGSLAVSGGDAIIPVINRYIRIFLDRELTIVASRDWHPQMSSHFEKYGGKWPEHCIQGSIGAEFCRGLRLPPETSVFSKGTDAQKDDYSALQGIDDDGITMARFLDNCGISELYVCGLATDYCVKETVLEAIRFGFTVMVLVDAVRGVDLRPGDAGRAMEEMAAAGALFLMQKDFYDKT